MDIRDEIITGTFAIGADGRKEPIDWRDYALKLERLIEKLRQPPVSGELPLTDYELGLIVGKNLDLFKKLRNDTSGNSR